MVVNEVYGRRIVSSEPLVYSEQLVLCAFHRNAFWMQGTRDGSLCIRFYFRILTPFPQCVCVCEVAFYAVNLINFMHNLFKHRILMGEQVIIKIATKKLQLGKL